MKNFQQRRRWAFAVCRKAQVRLTPLRVTIMDFFAQQQMPASLQMVTEVEGVQGHCDLTTVYRTLMLFQDVGLIRRVTTAHKADHFVLNAPGESASFIVCRDCGTMGQIRLPEALAAEIEQVTQTDGFSAAPPDFEVHSLCETCEEQIKTRVRPSKLSARKPRNKTC